MSVFGKREKWAYFVKVTSGKKSEGKRIAYFYPKRNLLKCLKSFNWDFGTHIEIWPVAKDYLSDEIKENLGI